MAPAPGLEKNHVFKQKNGFNLQMPDTKLYDYIITLHALLHL